MQGQKQDLLREQGRSEELLDLLKERSGRRRVLKLASMRETGMVAHEALLSSCVRREGRCSFILPHAQTRSPGERGSRLSGGARGATSRR